MKLFIQTVLLCVVLSFNLQAQTGRGKISAGEYYLDTDPGAGNGVALTLTGSLSDAFRIAVQSASAGLPPGLHTLNVRLKDSLSWGPVFKTILKIDNVLPARISNVSVARAYWDNDSVAAVNLLIVEGNVADPLNLFAGSVLPSGTGMHKLKVQVMDANGNFSLPFTTTVNIENALTTPRIISAALGRAYWDNNPGSAAGIIIVNGNAGNAFNGFINATPLNTFNTPGLHKLNVQLLDPNGTGNYSPAFSTVVCFENERKNTASLRVYEGRVWLDNDTPPASGNMLSFNGNFNEAVNAVYQTLPVTVGQHVLHVQVRDSANGWGPEFKTVFMVENPIAYRNIEITQGQFYFDGNLSSAYGFIAADGNFSDAAELMFKDTTIQLTAGLHTLYTRVMDVAGNWSTPFKTLLNVENAITSRDVKLTEGQVWVDSGQPVPLYSTNGNFTQAVEGAQSVLLSSGLSTGLHTLNVRMKGNDNNWGPVFKTAFVVSPCSSTPTPVVSVSGSLSFCNGDSVVLTANAGFNSYTWIRDNVMVGNGPSYVAKVSGNYTVVVTDTTNCPNSSVPKNITVITPAVTITSGGSICPGEYDTLTATPGYTQYIWSTGANTNSIITNQSGNYIVTVTDINGCTNSATTSVNFLPLPPQPVITASGPTSFCPGNQVTLTSSVSSNFTWSNGVTSPSFTSDTSGFYILTVTGSNGCKNFAAITTERYNYSATISANGPTTFCDNQPTTLSVSLSEPSSQFFWTTGNAITPDVTTENQFSIVPDNSGSMYAVLASINGCPITSNILSIEVLPSPPVPSLIAGGPLDFCNGNDVTLTSDTAYAHLWSNGATTQSITVSQSGTFTDTVYNVYGCRSVSLPVTVNVHPTASVTANNPTTFCQGDSVTLTANPSSGVIYAWNNGALTQSITVNASGNYSVIVTETANGCSDTAFVPVQVNPLPSGSIAATGPTLACSGSLITLNASGSANTKFQWYVNGTPITYSVWNLNCACYVTYNVYGPSYAASSAGSYSALVIDTLTGCTYMTNSISVSFQSPPVPVITANGGSTICINAYTILSSTTAAGYLWSTGETSKDIIAATAGYYTVTVYDNLGCTSSSVPTLVAFFPVATITSSGAVSFCSGDSVTLTAHPVGTYEWSNGQTGASITTDTTGVFSVTVTDVNGCESESQVVATTVNPLPSGIISAAGSTTVCSGQSVILNTSGSPNCIYKWYSNGSPITYMTWYGLVHLSGYSYAATASGSYSAMIVDTLTGCTSMTNAISVFVRPLPAASVTQTATILCNGGSDAALQVSANGTVAPYSYYWNTGANTASISGVPAGQYIAIVTDVFGCTGADTFQVSQPSPLAPYAYSPANSGGYNISCYGGNDGTAVATAGGTPPYTYQWNTGSVAASITNLFTGTYTVTITDANNCSGTSSVTLLQPPPVSVTLAPSVFTGGNNVRCFGGADGSITAIRSGGTGYSTYLWSDSTTQQTAVNLVAGTYSVTVTDSTGCSASASITLTAPAPFVNSYNASAYNGYGVSCFNANDGTITLNISGSTPGYTYWWNDSSTARNRNGLFSGTYSVIIADTNGCTDQLTITLTEPDSLYAYTTGSLLNCYGDNNGSASVTGGGGNGPYTFSWSTGATTAAIAGLSAGQYIVTATDTRGCTVVTNAVVEQPLQLQGYAFGTYVDCGTQIGLLSVTAAGGNAPYSFLWSNGSVAAFQTNLPIGNYSVTVTDSHGCIDTAYAVIVNPDSLIVNVNDDYVTCENSLDGELFVNVSGGVAPYMYLWSNGATSQQIDSLATGNYSVIVTDANGCTAVRSPNVIPQVIISSTFSYNSSCVAGQSSVTAIPANGTAPYMYQWNTGATTQTITGIVPGYYTVTVTDANGCAGIDTADYQGIQITASGPTVFCHGDSVLLSVSEGAGYLWNTGATTRTITVTNSGTFSASVNGCSAANTITTLKTYCTQDVQLKVFFQGFYQGNGTMAAVIDPVNLPIICDSVTVQLADSATKLIQSVATGTITTSGTGDFYFSGLEPGHRYYLVIRHRNSLETWSKYSFLFLNPSMQLDFTSQ